MPYVKRRKRKRRGRKRKYRSYPTALVTKSPMPLQFKTKLRYCENFSLDPGLTGSCDVKIMNAGGLYDPDVSGTGHQPRGFDQLIPLYDHFVVIGAKITATFASRVSSAYPTMCGIALRDGTTAETDAREYLEGGTNRSAVISPDASGMCVATRTLTYSPKKFLGRSHPMSDPTLKGSATADPSESAFFHVWVAPIQANNESPIDVLITVDYITVFIEPKDVGMS